MKILVVKLLYTYNLLFTASLGIGFMLLSELKFYALFNDLAKIIMEHTLNISTFGVEPTRR